MTDDFYAVLGISSTATPEEIKSAYRRKALQCHPDRGGSHIQMVQVNLAYEILSDLDRRRTYDAARSSTSGTSTQEAASRDAHAARANAENYPKRWSDFEVWLSHLTGDFAKANHGSRVDGFYGFRYPTVTNSVSGWIFIGFGIAVVEIIGVALFSSSKPPMNWVLFTKLIFFLGLGGAWIGAGVHRAIGKSIRTVNGQTQSADERTSNPEPHAKDHVVKCEKCGQKLRLPVSQGDVTVTCPSCRNQFSTQT